MDRYYDANIKDIYNQRIDKLLIDKQRLYVEIEEIKKSLAQIRHVNNRLTCDKWCVYIDVVVW